MSLALVFIESEVLRAGVCPFNVSLFFAANFPVLRFADSRSCDEREAS